MLQEIGVSGSNTRTVSSPTVTVSRGASEITFFSRTMRSEFGSIP